MKLRNAIVLVMLVCLVFTGLLSSQVAFAQAQQKMTKEQYRAELAQWQAREREAKSKLDACSKEQAALQEQLGELDNQIAALREEIYRLLGYTQEEIDAFQRELEQIRDQIRGLLALSPQELYEKLDEVERIGARLMEMSQDKRAKLPDIARLLSEVMELYQRLKEAAARAKPSVEIYSVVKGDYLWRIAKKPNIYDNPFQWIRIYTFNREQIKNPDLIYPDQKFKIHRETEKGQYLVQKGDFLGKIAGQNAVYSDPFQWKKIYEANREVINDPNLIYPWMVLVVP